MRTRVVALCLAIIGLCGCASDTAFSAKFAPQLRRDGMKLSLFGVYKDGRLSSEAWDDLSARFAPAFGKSSCEVIYNEALVVNDADLAGALDDRSRADGVTDDLAELFVPAATGDTIALLTVMGMPAREPANGSKGPASAPPSAVMPSTQGARRASAQAGGLGADPPFVTSRRDSFDVALTLYSVREHRNVGVIAMTYEGKNRDAGLAAFVQRLRTELPHATCVGWNRDVRIDAERVRSGHSAD